MVKIPSVVSHFALHALLGETGAQGLTFPRQDTTPVWLTLPPTPSLPSPISEARIPIDGVELWIQKYNEDASQTPLVLDHGGLGYSAYFGAVLSRLIAKGHYVIALDRRGHGRSTFKADDDFTFDLFANNIYDQLKAAGIGQYNVVGWSDGGATTLSALLNDTISPTIEKAFLFGTFMLPSDSNSSFPDTDIYAEFVSRCAQEYSELQPGANFTQFATKVATLEATLPQFTTAQLAAISGSRVRIAGAQYDEAVNLDVPAKLQAAIPGSSLVILNDVSHFAPLQDPDQFTSALEDFFYA
ncbi:Alpha/Beta hydrolase protein [Biscogniauxia marginata]|nr:Alpha/Beta hydrolase protein [Biscogniauxia marginata]